MADPAPAAPRRFPTVDVFSIPDEVRDEWQRAAELMAKVMEVSATMVLEFDETHMTVLASGGIARDMFPTGTFAQRHDGYYCEAVVVQDAMITVRDATHDPRWERSPDVEMGLISYVGMPLHRPDGRVFGTICALDTVARDYPDAQVELVQHFAGLVENDLRTLDAESRRATAEEQLDRQADRQRAILDRLPAMVASFDRAARCTLANSTYCEVLGRDRADVCGRRLSELVGPETWTLVRDHVDAVLEGKDVHDERAIPTARGPRLTSISMVPSREASGAVVGFLLLGVDVHDRRSAESALRDSEARFRLVFESVAGGSWDWDVTTGTGYIDGSSMAALGYAPLDGNPLEFWWSKLHPADDARVRAALDDYRHGVARHFAAEYRVRANDGSYRWYQDTGRIVGRDAAGEATRIVGIHLDISERKTSELEAGRHEAFLRTILDSIVDGVLATDCDGRIVSLNPIAETMLGSPAEDLVGRPIDEVCSCVGAMPLGEMVHAAIHRTHDEPAIQHEIRRVLVDGETRRVSTSIAPILARSGAVRGAVVVCRDVTDELALEERLQQGEKMQAVGQLAGGIAHDFNNMLAAIRTGAETVLAHSERLDGAARENVQMILQAADRAAELTGKLLAFSRKHDIQQPTTVDLHAVVRDAVAILRRTTEQRIEIDVALGAKTAHVMGSYAALENAVLNLVINARHAMPTGGRISIRTALRDLGADECAASPFALQPGRYVSLTVRDTGVGIPRELRNKIFEPFFTTREPDQGTGLGLFAVYGTAVSHRGSVTADSPNGRGTTFEMLLPITSAPEPAPRSEPKRRSVKRRVLLVDDEALVRETARRALEHLGHEVIVASGGREAVAAYEADRFDVVLLDMHMPGMDGAATLEAIRGIDPGARIIICSGCANPDRMQAVIEAGIDGHLDKPFRLAEIDEAITCAIEV